jgi:predicted AAA+ superfamily ATPase
MSLIGRHLESRVHEALDAFRVVVVHGARQCGKTTLARQVIEQRGGSYVSLDDDVQREAAHNDPMTFLTGLRLPCAIDEIQLVGDRLIRALKIIVDRDPSRGNYLLSGSTNFLTVPTISESLAGRVRILQLEPLSEAEIVGTSGQAVDGWFDGSVASALGAFERTDYLERVCRGGYPEPLGLTTSERTGWFESYVATVIQRDLVALADIRNSAALPRLLRWTAAVSGEELNATRAARDLGVNRNTIHSYLEWLRTVFLVRDLPPWSRNLSSRATQRSKIHLTDSGLAADLIGTDVAGLTPVTAPATGKLLESFVINEVARLLSASMQSIHMSHYRDKAGREIDLMLERRDGAVVAVEVKATSSPAATHARHLRWLRDHLDRADPAAFCAGVLLHTGEQQATIGDRLHVVPISALWS